MQEEFVGTSSEPIIQSVFRNLRSYFKDLSWSAASTGILVVLVSSTGPAALMLQAAKAGHFSTNQTISWLSICWIGSGVVGLLLTLRYRMPIFGAWSSPSVALLVTGLSVHSINEAVAAYYLSALAILLIGVTGIFEKILSLVPRAVIMAMLGGVLFTFGVQIFVQLPSEPVIVLVMLATFFFGRRRNWRAPVVLSTVVGLIVTIVLGKAASPHMVFGLTKFVWITPKFSIGGIFTLAIPLVLLTLTTQFAPGSAVLISNGYTAPINSMLKLSGVISFLTAGFLNSGLNCAAISAAMGVSPQAEPDKNRRYTAAITSGFAYIIVGILGSTMMALFNLVPSAFLATLTGLALLPSIASSTHEALVDSDYREAAMVTFLVTVSNIHVLKLGAPFWGLIAGVLIHQITSKKKAKK
ncbi:MAG: benzoate/H(+) symporter BenE family transporter [Actinomycetes bacterium]